MVPKLRSLLIGALLLGTSAATNYSAPRGKVLHLSDFHIDDQYDVQRGDPKHWCHSDQQQDNETPNRGIGPFGDHNCDSPMSLVEYMLSEARRILPDPDFIIWTGDSASHNRYNVTKMVQTVDSATSAIGRHFPGTLVIPVVGNHDIAPSNDFPDPGDAQMYEGVFNVWRQWIGDGAEETFVRGGYYRLDSPVDGQTFLVLNTNIYYIWNSQIANLTKHCADPLGQFAFLEAQMASIRAHNRTAHILAHVSIGAFEYYNYDEQWSPEMPRVFNDRLHRIFVEYAESIGWMLFGHLHSDTFRVLKDAQGKAVQRIFLSPAVTTAFNLNNPSFRVLHYHTNSTNDIQDIEYFVELDALNKNGAKETRVRLEYSMREAYRLEALDARAMDALLGRMRENETLFREYIAFNKVMFDPPALNESQRNSHLCVMEYVDYDRLERCMLQANSAASNNNFVVLPSWPPHLLLLLTAAVAIWL